MAESDTLSDKKDIARKTPPANPQQQQQQNEITIPQIILTEPPTQHSDANNINSTSPLALSPKSVPYKPSPPPSSTVIASSPLPLPSPSPSPSPLPLTKDLLQRKNKLDRILSQKEKHRHQQHQQRSIDFSSSSAVDERVTAGLGISTPNDNHGPSSAGLRSRRPSSSRLSSSNRSEPEKATFSPSSQYHSEWSYDIDAFKSSTSGSSKGHHRHHRHNQSTSNYQQNTGTSVSGSSNRNSVSMRAYSANHRYMDRHHGQHNHTPYFERPDQHLNRNDDYKSKYFLLDLLFHAANRVVNSRAPESKQVTDKEIFDFNAIITDDNTPPVEFNEKSTLPKEPTSPHIITPATVATTTTTATTTNIRDNRYSWLSMATSLDEKSSDFDNESMFPAFSSEKKLPSQHTVVDDFEPIKITAKKPLSLSDELLTNPLQGHSLYLFSPTNKFRIHVWKFIRKR
jgi:hypothetical protein